MSNKVNDIMKMKNKSSGCTKSSKAARRRLVIYLAVLTHLATFVAADNIHDSYADCNYETLDRSRLFDGQQNVSSNLLTCVYKRLPKTYPPSAARSVENLKIKCDKFFFNDASSKSSSFFDSFDNLKNLFVDNCDGSFLRTFGALKSLSGLTIRNYKAFWGRAEEIMEDSGLDNTNDFEPFENLSNIKFLDVSANAIAELHRNFFCDFHKLNFLNLTTNQIYNLTNFQFSSSRLSPMPIKNCVFSMSHLILTGNQLNFLPFSFFSNFVNLKLLRLNRNSISFIENFVFSNLKQLDMLDLSENKIQNIQPELFDNLQNLRTLNLEKNSMKILPPEILTNLKKLEILNLSSNFLSSNWINFMTFKSLFSLRLLDLSANKITALGNSIFVDLHALEVLDLKKNLIESIAMDTFANLTSLTSLVLSHNFIKNVNFSLNSLVNLNVLSLDFNEIYSVEKHLVANSPKLIDLHLNNNKFFKIPTFVENFQILKFLDLGENFIKNLADLENFSNLKYLYGLRLTENQIEVLERNQFSHVKNLQIVNLSKNRIRLIDRETFTGNNFLQAIRLDGNHLKNIDFMFENLTQLVFLNMSENLLEVFDYDNFPKNLQFLDISKNQINVIKFPNDTSQNLKTLNLASNRLTEISGVELPRNLEDLHLQRNLIEKISPYTFFKKPSLKSVDLRHNKITHLSEISLRISSTKSDEKLPEFQLAGNPLVCDCHLKWMWQDNGAAGQQSSSGFSRLHLDIDNLERFPYLLEQLASSDDGHPSYAAQKQLHEDLDNSAFDSQGGNYVDLPARTFPPSSGGSNSIRTQPKIIDFDQMTCSFSNSRDKLPIRRLNPNLFLCKYNNFCSKGCQCCENYSCECQQKCPDKCNCYHNTNWEINFVNCSSSSYVKGLPAMIPMEATHLHLDGNQLETIKDFAFIGRRSLRILYLNHSRIQQLTNRTFFGLKNLELLSLKQNEIQQLNGDEFNELESVKYIFLQNNRIELIEAKTFVQLRHLQVLKLNGNRLLTFDLHFLPAALVQLDIGENLLDCDCELIKTLKLNGAIVRREALKCHPNQTRGEYFHLMNETNFCSEKLALGNMYFFEKNLPIFLIVFLVCLFSLIVVFIFHQRIMFCCYKKFNLRFCKKRNDKNKFFDGFLMFSKKDENFLIDDFLKHFETEGSYYKFFLFFHDFSIFNEQILKNCENSQKIILFMSENFLKNEWKKIEFKKIFYEILKTKKRKKLLIVFLDNFDNKNFDPELKLILKTNFILRWGEKLFWEKFKFFLPSLNRNNQLQHPPTAPHDLESFCQNFHLNNLRNNANHHHQPRNLPSIHI